MGFSVNQGEVDGRVLNLDEGGHVLVSVAGDRMWSFQTL